MRLPKIAFAFLSLVLLAAAAHAQAEKSATPSTSESPKAFLGRWDLTLKSGAHEYPSWLELSEDNGQLKA
ncbi:MAG: hypothetical protein WAN32_17100, partial [Candidatus Acidiferrum sp.]